MRIAVVIPFYNGDRFIQPCLESVLSGNIELAAIYVVNNSSVPTGIHQLYPNHRVIRIIDCKPSIGFGRANNIGASFAIKENMEIIVFLNQDTIVLKDTIANLISPFTYDSKMALSVPVIYRYDDENSIEEEFFKMYMNPIHKLRSDLSLKGILEKYYEISHAVSGACVAVRSTDILELGLFEPEIYMYGEDVDLFTRYKSYNKKAVLVTNSKVRHLHSHLLAKGDDLIKIKTYIHRFTPYSIWKWPAKSIVKRVWSLFAWLCREYATVLNKMQFLIFKEFVKTDVSLPYRLLKISKHRNIDILKSDIENQVRADILSSS